MRDVLEATQVMEPGFELCPDFTVCIIYASSRGISLQQRPWTGLFHTECQHASFNLMNKSYHSLRTYQVPGVMLGTGHTLFSLILAVDRSSLPFINQDAKSPEANCKLQGQCGAAGLRAQSCVNDVTRSASVAGICCPGSSRAAWNQGFLIIPKGRPDRSLRHNEES